MVALQLCNPSNIDFDAISIFGDSEIDDTRPVFAFYIPRAKEVRIYDTTELGRYMMNKLISTYKGELCELPSPTSFWDLVRDLYLANSKAKVLVQGRIVDSIQRKVRELWESGWTLRGRVYPKYNEELGAHELDLVGLYQLLSYIREKRGVAWPA